MTFRYSRYLIPIKRRLMCTTSFIDIKSKRKEIVYNLMNIVRDTDSDALHKFINSNITTHDNDLEIIEFTKNVCISDEVGDNRIHHILACDIIDLLKKNNPSLMYNGYLSLIQVCLEKKFVHEAFCIYNRALGLNISIGQPITEEIIEILSKEYHIDSIINLLESSKLITTNIIKYIADPLIITGNVKIFAKYFEIYLKNKDISDLNNITNMIMLARLKRSSCMTLSTDEEESYMDNIMNDIEHFNHQLVEENNNNNNEDIKHFINLLSFRLLCFIERNIRLRYDLSNTPIGQLLLPISRLSEEFHIEDRDTIENFDMEIPDITNELEKISKKEENTNKSNILLFRKNLWTNPSTGESFYYKNSDVENSENIKLIKQIIDLFSRVNGNISSSLSSEYYEEDEDDDDIDDEDFNDDNVDDDDSDSISREIDDDEDDVNEILIRSNTKGDNVVNIELNGLNDINEEEYEDIDDDIDDDDIYNNDFDDYDYEIDSRPDMNKLGKPTFSSNFPFPIHDLSETLKKQNPPIQLSFSEDIFRLNIPFPNEKSFLTKDLKRTTPSSPKDDK